MPATGQKVYGGRVVVVWWWCGGVVVVWWFGVVVVCFILPITEAPQLTLFNSVLDWVVAIGYTSRLVVAKYDKSTS